MTFAERLRELREKVGMTQEQLADQSGVNLWTIRGYEQGRREPNWKALLALAAALRVRAEAFADCEEGQPKPKPKGRPKKAVPVAPGKQSADGATQDTPTGVRLGKGKRDGQKGKGGS